MLVDCGCQLALWPLTAVGGEVLPEDGVIGVAAEVEGEVLAEQRRLRGDRAVFARSSQLLDCAVGARHVRGVVLAVVQFESGVVVIQFGENVFSHVTCLPLRKCCESRDFDRFDCDRRAALTCAADR